MINDDGNAASALQRAFREDVVCGPQTLLTGYCIEARDFKSTLKCLRRKVDVKSRNRNDSRYKSIHFTSQVLTVDIQHFITSSLHLRWLNLYYHQFLPDSLLMHYWINAFDWSNEMRSVKTSCEVQQTAMSRCHDQPETPGSTGNRLIRAENVKDLNVFKLLENWKHRRTFNHFCSINKKTHFLSFHSRIHLLTVSV